MVEVHDLVFLPLSRLLLSPFGSLVERKKEIRPLLQILLLSKASFVFHCHICVCNCCRMVHDAHPRLVHTTTTSLNMRCVFLSFGPPVGLQPTTVTLHRNTARDYSGHRVVQLGCAGGDNERGYDGSVGASGQVEYRSSRGC